MTNLLLAEFPATWAHTRDALHAYALAVGAIPRIHAVPHPQWWHASLKVQPDGLVTSNMSLPAGGIFGIRMDLSNHEIVIATSSGERQAIPMTGGSTGTEMGDRLIGIASDFGLDASYDRSKFENEAATEYDPEAASAFFHTMVGVHQVFESHRSNLGVRVSPIQIWPHGFDLSTEWFGTRVVSAEQDGVTTELPSQLNLGFYPGIEPYFYSNPWPFAGGELTSNELPDGAVWHTDGWEGSMLPYSAVVGRPDAAEVISRYAAEVFRLAAPTLEAGA